MKKYTNFVFLMLFIVLQSCIGGSNVWKNDNINTETRYEIKLLNDKLVKSIRTLDTIAIRSMISDSLLLKSDNNLNKMLKNIQSTFKSDVYRRFDEYNFHNSIGKVTNFIPATNGNDNDYIIDYQALNKEMYVSLLLIGDDNFSYMVTVVYGKYESGWKINILHFRQYRYNGKTAPEWHKSAQENYKKSYLMDAHHDAHIGNKLLETAVWRYKNHEEIQKLNEKLDAEFKNRYQFPLVLEEIATKPRIFYFEYAQDSNEGLIPVISYLTTINLSIKDTTALKIENEKIKPEVNNLFLGINKNRKAVVYLAFNEIPDGKKEVPRFKIIDFVNDTLPKKAL